MEKQFKCPHCGSDRTNNIGWTNYYCVDCGVEFDPKHGKIFKISYDGNLIPIK